MRRRLRTCQAARSEQLCLRGERRTWCREGWTRRRRRCWAPDRQALGRSGWLVAIGSTVDRGRPARTSPITPRSTPWRSVEDVHTFAPPLLSVSSSFLLTVPLSIIEAPAPCLRDSHTSVPETVWNCDTHRRPSRTQRILSFPLARAVNCLQKERSTSPTHHSPFTLN